MVEGRSVVHLKRRRDGRRDCRYLRYQLMGAAHAATSTLTDPVPGDRRVVLIDALRGFALFGVVTANMLAGSGFNPFAHPEQISAPIDHAVFWAMDVLVSGKFMALFSLLFGVGFGLQLRRAADRGTVLVPRYIRRLAGLFLIGILHHIFLGAGDILKDYAILGLALLLFRNASDRVLLTAAVLAMFTGLVAGILVDFLGIPQPARADPALVARVFAEGNYLGRVSLNLASLPGKWWVFVMFNSSNFTLFLLGFYAARHRLLEEHGRARPLLLRVFFIAVVVALAGLLFRAVLERAIAGLPTVWQRPANVVFQRRGLALALAYGSGFALLWNSNAAVRRRLAPLAKVGRLALTNYLSVSLATTILFFGMRLSGSVRPSVAVGLGVLLWCTQVIWSDAWLRRYRFGPAEWLWRTLTYGRLQPMRDLELATAHRSD